MKSAFAATVIVAVSRAAKVASVDDDSLSLKNLFAWADEAFDNYNEEMAA